MYLSDLWEREGHTESMKTIEELQEMNEQLIAELREMKVARDLAESANQNKSMFLANMSHEIRTPLNIIMGFSDLLVSTNNAEEKKTYAKVLEANCNLLLQLIDDVLDLSKVESGISTSPEEKIDLNALIGELIQMMRLRVFTEDVTLDYEIPSLTYFIYGEKKGISQIIINLLTNAIKFTSKGRICLGYENRGDLIYFYVSDTGCGIPRHQLQYIFERFTRLDVSKVGTGLGLAICKALVERMGGGIGVNSEVGKGSEFWFAIPFRSAE